MGGFLACHAQLVPGSWMSRDADAAPCGHQAVGDDGGREAAGEELPGRGQQEGVGPSGQSGQGLQLPNGNSVGGLYEAVLLALLEGFR